MRQRQDVRSESSWTQRAQGRAERGGNVLSTPAEFSIPGHWPETLQNSDNPPVGVRETVRPILAGRPCGSGSWPGLWTWARVLLGARDDLHSRFQQDPGS